MIRIPSAGQDAVSAVDNSRLGIGLAPHVIFYASYETSIMVQRRHKPHDFFSAQEESVHEEKRIIVCEGCNAIPLIYMPLKHAVLFT